MEESSESHTLEFTADERLTTAATRRFWLQFLGWKSPVAWLIGTIVLTATALSRHSPWTGYEAVAFFLFLPIIWANGYFVFLRRSRRQLNRMQSRQIRYVFATDTVTNTSDLGKAEVPWRTFQKVCRFPDVWLLYYGSNVYVSLPAREMDDATKAFIVAQASKHGAKVT